MRCESLPRRPDGRSPGRPAEAGRGRRHARCARTGPRRGAGARIQRRHRGRRRRRSPGRLRPDGRRPLGDARDRSREGQCGGGLPRNDARSRRAVRQAPALRRQRCDARRLSIRLRQRRGPARGGRTDRRRGGRERRRPGRQRPHDRRRGRWPSDASAQPLGRGRFLMVQWRACSSRSRGVGTNTARGELGGKVPGRGNRSSPLTLARPRGQAPLRRRSLSADVLMETFPPGPFEKGGLGWDVLLKDNPRLVFARVSGWGQDGPYRDRPGFGTMVEAMSGFAASTGPADRPPTLPSFPMADMVAALSGTAAVLAALRHRDNVSGRGQVIDISLYEPLLSVLGPTAAEHALDGTVRARHGNQSDNASPRGTYQTRDGKRVALSASTPASAAALFAGLGLGVLLSDPRFATNDARVAHNDLVDAALTRAIGSRTLDEMLYLFETTDLTASPSTTSPTLPRTRTWSGAGSSSTFRIPTSEACA